APTPQLQQYHQPYATNPNDAYTANAQYMYTATESYSQAYPHPQVQQYAAPDAAYSAYAHLHAQAPTTAGADSAGHGKSARRRDREIQQQLLAGNTAVLGDSSIRTIQATDRNWDAVQYSDRAKQEVHISDCYPTSVIVWM